MTHYGMTPEEEKVLRYLGQFVTDHKKAFIERVLDARTRYVTVVLENIYQSQNASAAVRTCECMGLQDMHIIENTARFQFNAKVLKGANKWMTLERYRTRNANNTQTCFETLRNRGYRILVADPAESGKPIGDIDVEAGKIALVFGNELHGLSDYALSHADERIKIPMFGFTESLNISVSVAICLNTIMPKVRQMPDIIGLTPDEKEHIRLAWYRKIVRRSAIMEREFLRTIQ